MGREKKGVLGGFVGDEEEGGRGRGAEEGGADAGVDAAEAAGGVEALGGLEARFERVEGVEGEVDGGACDAACLVGFDLVWFSR